MSDIEKDIEQLKIHCKAIEEILMPYIVDGDALSIEQEIIDNYRQLHSYKIAVLSLQKDISKKSDEINKIMQSYISRT